MRPSFLCQSMPTDNQTSSIIQRAGVVPMSIAGIAKEVSTILASSWFFGDHLTLLNGVGVSITVCGQCIAF